MIWLFCCFLLMTRLCDQSTQILTDKYYILSLWEVLLSLNVTISNSFLTRENALMTFCCQPNLLLKVGIQMIRGLHISLWKTMGKVTQTLVTLTSHCDFHFKHLKMSFIENKLIVDLNSNCHDCSTKKNRRKVAWFLANWYGRISHRRKKTVNDRTFCCQWHYLLKLVTWIIRVLHISLWKTMGKSGTDSPISGYSYSYSVSFISNISISASVKINWLCTWTLVVRTAAFKRTEKKLHGFSQTYMVEFLID